MLSAAVCLSPAKAPQHGYAVDGTCDKPTQLAPLDARLQCSVCHRGGGGPGGARWGWRRRARWGRVGLALRRRRREAQLDGEFAFYASRRRLQAWPGGPGDGRDAHGEDSLSCSLPPPPPTLPLPLLRPVFMAVHRSLGGRFWTSLYTLLCCSCGLRWEPFNEHSGACCNVVAVARTEPLARNEVAGTPSLTSPSPSASLSLSFSLYS